jgi:hypothetical protein
MSGDEIMQGFVISLFTLCGVSAFGYCMRLRLKNRSIMKKSESMEDLNSVDTTDPIQIRVEE